MTLGSFKSINFFKIDFKYIEVIIMALGNTSFCIYQYIIKTDQSAAYRFSFKNRKFYKFYSMQPKIVRSYKIRFVWNKIFILKYKSVQAYLKLLTLTSQYRPVQLLHNFKK